MLDRRAGMRRLLALGAAVLAAALLLGACDDNGDGSPTPTATPTLEPTPTATASPTPTPTATPTATGTPTEPAAGPPAPTDVSLSGELPDLTATVPPGGGELGRVSIQWDADSDPDGFRIYLQDCDGEVTLALAVEGSERMHGPLQPCRPGGNVGVSAFDETGESEIVWSQ